MNNEDIGKKYRDENGNEFELMSFCDEPTVTFKDSKGENTTFSQHSILMKQLTPVRNTLSDKIVNVSITNDGYFNILHKSDIEDFIKELKNEFNKDLLASKLLIDATIDKLAGDKLL